MLCGITQRFHWLFPTRGQVIDGFLTRSPLYSPPEGDFRVRLACLNHAANVRSEPGSNSQVENLITPPRLHRDPRTEALEANAQPQQRLLAYLYH